MKFKSSHEILTSEIFLLEILKGKGTIKHVALHSSNIIEVKCVITYKLVNSGKRTLGKHDSFQWKIPKRKDLFPSTKGPKLCSNSEIHNGDAFLLYTITIFVGLTVEREREKITSFLIYPHQSITFNDL